MAQLLQIKSGLSTMILLLCYCIVMGQGSTLNTMAVNDDYTVLRSMVVRPFNQSAESLKYEHLIYGDTNKFIKYFIGSNSFLVQSDIDIYNNFIYADLDRDGTIQPYGFAPGRIDSFYLTYNDDLDAFAKYIYHPLEGCFAKVIDQGKYTIVEGIHFKFQKGNLNPAIDFDSFEDKINVRKRNYLIDNGIWHEIPKNKKELIDFIKIHFQKKIDKSILREKKSMTLLISLN